MYKIVKGETKSKDDFTLVMLKDEISISVLHNEKLYYLNDLDIMSEARGSHYVLEHSYERELEMNGVDDYIPVVFEDKALDAFIKHYKLNPKHREFYSKPGSLKAIYEYVNLISLSDEDHDDLIEFAINEKIYLEHLFNFLIDRMSDDELNFYNSEIQWLFPNNSFSYLKNYMLFFDLKTDHNKYWFFKFLNSARSFPIDYSILIKKEMVGLTKFIIEKGINPSQYDELISLFYSLDDADLKKFMDIFFIKAKEFNLNLIGIHQLEIVDTINYFSDNHIDYNFQDFLTEVNGRISENQNL